MLISEHVSKENIQKDNQGYTVDTVDENCYFVVPKKLGKPKDKV